MTVTRDVQDWRNEREAGMVYFVYLVGRTRNSSRRTRQTRKTSQPDRRARARCTNTGRPLHIQTSHVDSDLLKIITLYELDPAEWYDYARRR
ncbi:MAG: hypothetical protein JW395_0938 [Nitrospira sp.]|nr:hypothetical protein [Nitrospira sp.]